MNGLPPDDEFRALVATLDPDDPALVKPILEYTTSSDVLSEDRFEAMITDPASDEPTRFAAFVVLTALARRHKNWHEFDRLLDAHRSRFPGFQIDVELLEAESLAQNTHDRAKLLRAERLTRNALPTRDWEGTRIFLTQILLDLYELSDERDTDRLDDAARHIAKAMTQSDSPNVLAARARVRAAQGHFEDAKADIRTAISLENSKRADYAIRLLDYKAIEIDITVRKGASRVRSSAEHAVAEVEASRRSVLEVLGLLAAIIAFIVVGSNVARGLNLEKSVVYTASFAGLILIVFSAFHLLFTGAPKSRTWQSWVGMLVGALLIGATIGFVRLT